MRYTDRSRTELDFTCHRARYWAYEYKGRGLAPMQEPKELAFGKAMAEQLQAIKAGRPFTTTAFTGDDQLLANALLIGYRDIVWPRWQALYEVVSVEQEVPLELREWLIYQARPDTITRRKADHTLWYGPEDKTTAWLDSLLTYANNVQLHATAFCIEAHYPEQVSGCLVQGLYKGFVKEGKLFHPLVYGYVKDGIPGISPDQWSTKWVRNWERAPISQAAGGVEGFIARASPADLAQVFPNSEPVMINRVLAKQYLEQIVLREEAIADWHQRTPTEQEALMPKVFPQNFSQCDQFSKGRSPCSYKEACFNATTRRFPMTLYKWREPHHVGEAEALTHVQS
jgi:hypothetical protein